MPIYSDDLEAVESPMYMIYSQNHTSGITMHLSSASSLEKGGNLFFIATQWTLKELKAMSPTVISKCDIRMFSFWYSGQQSQIKDTGKRNVLASQESLTFSNTFLKYQ